MSNFTHNILISQTDTNTGVIVEQYGYKRKQKTKGGWRKVYVKNYTEMQELCIKGLADLKVWNHIITNTSADFKVRINVTRLAGLIKTTRPTIHSFINRALENGFVKKMDDAYLVNPFICIPYGVSDELSAQAQQQWESL